jgi:hypothetical protein
MMWLWLGGCLIWAGALILLARWMRRREAEVLPRESTLTDEERAQAQLGIALTAGSSSTGLY